MPVIPLMEKGRGLLACWLAGAGSPSAGATVGAAVSAAVGAAVVIAVPYFRQLPVHCVPAVQVEALVRIYAAFPLESASSKPCLICMPVAVPYLECDGSYSWCDGKVSVSSVVV